MAEQIPPEIIKNITVLVVDDNFPTRDMVKSILRSVGFTEILQAENGNVALVKIREEDPKLVICDWNMPNMSGIELLGAVRQLPEFKELPFIMLTAEVYKENVKEAMDLGVTDYIAKPFTSQVLVQKVTEVINQKIVRGG